MGEQVPREKASAKTNIIYEGFGFWEFVQRNDSK